MSSRIPNNISICECQLAGRGGLRRVRSLSFLGWFCLLVWACSSVGPSMLAGEPLAGEPLDIKRLDSVRRPIESKRNLVFGEVDGVQLKGDLFRPADDKVYPVVVMIHGGAWSAGDKWHLHDHAREMAQAGFVAISINYRLAPLHRFPAQIDDCRLGLRWVAENAAEWQGDPQRIALWGYSAGAQLAGLLVTRPEPGDPAVWAAVLGGAPCEFSFIPERSQALAMVMGGTRKEFPQVYRDASPVEFASSAVCPTFFFHGKQDAIVPCRSSQLLHDKLVGLGVETEYHLVEGRGHMLTLIDQQSRQKAIEFLQRHLPAVE